MIRNALHAFQFLCWMHHASGVGVGRTWRIEPACIGWLGCGYGSTGSRGLGLLLSVQIAKQIVASIDLLRCLRPLLRLLGVAAGLIPIAELGLRVGQPGE